MADDQESIHDTDPIGSWIADYIPLTQMICIGVNTFSLQVMDRLADGISSLLDLSQRSWVGAAIYNPHTSKRPEMLVCKWVLQQGDKEERSTRSYTYYQLQQLVVPHWFPHWWYWQRIDGRNSRADHAEIGWQELSQTMKPSRYLHQIGFLRPPCRLVSLCLEVSLLNDLSVIFFWTME
jgi:hypothetical protein